jgi:hypothetical protein
MNNKLEIIILIVQKTDKYIVLLTIAEVLWSELVISWRVRSILGSWSSAAVVEVVLRSATVVVASRWSIVHWSLWPISRVVSVVIVVVSHGRLLLVEVVLDWLLLLWASVGSEDAVLSHRWWALEVVVVAAEVRLVVGVVGARLLWATTALLRLLVVDLVAAVWCGVLLLWLAAVLWLAWASVASATVVQAALASVVLA